MTLKSKSTNFNAIRILLSFIASVTLISCSYNPLSGNNHTTGSVASTVIGAGVGAGSVGVLGASKPLMGVAAVAGGAVGYYVSTLRYDAGGIYQSGGQVYQVGNYMGIYIPTDNLFEPNSADFLPQAAPILDSVADVLARTPNNNIIISGNTSGFGHSRWERSLSEKRAEKVSAYLWNEGINDFKERSTDTRKLSYIGYGDYLPIASDLNNSGIRANSRIQITSYPSNADLHLDARHVALHNVGEFKDSTPLKDTACKSSAKSCYESTYN